MTEGGLTILSAFAMELLPLKGTPKMNFYTVQGADDMSRLLKGGTPWPTGVNKSIVGEGAYMWGTLEDALSYKVTMSKYYNDLSIMKYSIETKTYNSLKTHDISGLSLSDQGHFLDEFSLYGQGKPHSFDHIIRPTTNFGLEYYFTPETFPKLKYNGTH